MMPTELYRTDTEPPMLIGQHCTRCNRDFFPPNPYGCEACGADLSALNSAEFVARGQVKALTTTPPPPKAGDSSGFTVGVIELEQGFNVRALLDNEHRNSIKPGTTVEAVVKHSPENEAANLFFIPTQIEQYK